MHLVLCFTWFGPIVPQNIWELIYPFAFGFFKPLLNPAHNYLVGGLGLTIALRVVRRRVVKLNLQLLQQVFNFSAYELDSVV